VRAVVIVLQKPPASQSVSACARDRRRRRVFSFVRVATHTHTHVRGNQRARCIGRVLYLLYVCVRFPALGVNAC